MKRKRKKVVGPVGKMIEYAAEAEARRIATELHGSDGLWTLYLTEAYRRCAGLPPLSYGDVESK